MRTEFSHSIIDPNGGGYEEERFPQEPTLMEGTTPGRTEVKHREEVVVHHPLYPVYVNAIKQCTHGKGERHGGYATPFLEQPWHHYAKLHGRGFLTGQAAKKLEEAASTREGEAFINEMLGALVYIGMAILNEQEKMKND